MKHHGDEGHSVIMVAISAIIVEKINQEGRDDVARTSSILQYKKT